MQKLRAIRERLSSHSEAPVEPVDARNVNPSSGRPEPSANPSEETTAPFASAPLESERATASMWDLVNYDDATGDDGPLPELEEILPALNEALVATEAAAEPEAPAPEQPRADATPPEKAERRSGRTKTRLLGFEHSSGKSVDIFEANKDIPAERSVRFPVGWMVVVDGPGRGASIPLLVGVSQIGRGEDQAIQLDFGDTSISRSNHAAIAFDEEQRTFFIGHGGKSNLVRLNGKPLLSTEALKNGDVVRIGETSLRLVALCGENFSWTDVSDAQIPADL